MLKQQVYGALLGERWMMRVRQPATHFPICDRYSWLVRAGCAADADWSLVGLTPVVTKTESEECCPGFKSQIGDIFLSL